MIVFLPNALPPKTANAIALGALAYTIAKALQYVLTLGRRPEIVGSPLKTLIPTLSEYQIAQLPIPINALPGARDVPSPYGSTRVYEWGPESGQKVLLVHGISTPCVALGSIAHGLVAKGCRVMLFDLYGIPKHNFQLIPLIGLMLLTSVTDLAEDFLITQRICPRILVSFVPKF
jgi:hypothetical protein